MESNTPGIVGGFKSNFFVCLLVIEFVVALFEAEEEEEEELVFVVVPTTAPVFSVFFFLATTEDASELGRQNSSPNQTAFGGHESLPF
jgi:hypothetical protein